MHRCLSPGAIGIRGLSLADSIRLAQSTGFESLAFDIREARALADQVGVSGVRELFDAAGVLPGVWGLPVAWNGAEEQYERDLDSLPGLASLAADLECKRTSTWCPPASDERDFDANWAWHVGRFRPIAEVLQGAGCRLGIEFIGPETLRAGRRFPFIHTLSGMMDLAEAIGTGNVGLLLDAWHLYTSGGTVEDLDSITAEDIVLVHVNDAPAGVPREEQLDQVRRLPMETGVIDLPAFISKLAELDYQGPVVAEPFSERLNEIAAEDATEAARITVDALNRMWAASGLS